MIRKQFGKSLMFLLAMLLLFSGCANLRVNTYTQLDRQEPVGDVNVTVTQQGLNQEPQTKITNNRGNAGFRLSSGMYSIIASKEGFFDSLRTIRFDGREMLIDLLLQPECTVMGSVVLPDGSVPAEVLVRLFDSENINRGEAISDRSGRFEIQPVPLGKYRIVAETLGSDTASYIGEKECNVNERLVYVDIEMARREFQPDVPDINPEQIGPGGQVRPPGVQ
jgi:hypothetical protein